MDLSADLAHAQDTVDGVLNDVLAVLVADAAEDVPSGVVALPQRVSSSTSSTRSAALHQQQQQQRGRAVNNSGRPRGVSALARDDSAASLPGVVDAPVATAHHGAVPHVSTTGGIGPRPTSMGGGSGADSPSGEELRAAAAAVPASSSVSQPQPSRTRALTLRWLAVGRAKVQRRDAQPPAPPARRPWGRS